MEIPSGGLSETSLGGRNINWGVSGAFSGRDGPAWSVRHTEIFLPACIRAGAQPFPDQYGEGWGGLPDPILEGGPTPPWPTPGDTRGISPSE